MRVYLSGPMSGKPNDNYDLFNTWAKFLREAGHIVLNPAENFDGAHNHPDGRPAYMRIDFEHVLNAEGIALLPGWNKSLGSCSEVLLGAQLGLPIYEIEMHTGLELMRRIDIDRYQFVLRVDGTAEAVLVPPKETVCQEADRIVSGDRGPQYGHPTINFERTARLWESFFNGDRKSSHEEFVHFTPSQVAVFMILLKIARHEERPKRDHIVDMIGYAKTLAMVEGYE